VADQRLTVLDAWSNGSTRGSLLSNVTPLTRQPWRDEIHYLTREATASEETGRYVHTSWGAFAL